MLQCCPFALASSLLQLYHNHQTGWILLGRLAPACGVLLSMLQSTCHVDMISWLVPPNGGLPTLVSCCAGRFAASAYLAGYNCMTERELRMTCGVVL